MNDKILKFRTIVVVLVIALAQNAFAQNPASLSPQPSESEEALIKKDIDQIMSNQMMMSPVPVNIGTGEAASRYTLGENDVIEITVVRHPEVSGQFAVNSEGKIQYEFVGDVKIAGLTKQDVADLLTEKLSKYIISPDVSVKITGYNSKVVYVIGEVGNPGKIFMRGDTITAREALVQAGLPLLSAKTVDGRLITPTADGFPGIKKVNVHKLLYEGDLRQDLVMKPGDTLYLPPTLMARALRVIHPVAQPIGEAAGTGRTITTGF